MNVNQKEIGKFSALYTAVILKGFRKEHNVGHLYIAKPALANFYQKLDPTNSFNVGIGHTSKLKYWGKAKS